MTKLLAIVAAVAFAFGATTSGLVVHKLWKGRVAATRVANLERQIEASNAANREVVRQYALDRAELEELQRRFQDAQDSTSDGECLPAADADRLRRSLGR